eukprot:248920-Pelagomonas_calceolata.AAC.2
MSPVVVHSWSFVVLCALRSLSSESAPLEGGDEVCQPHNKRWRQRLHLNLAQQTACTLQCTH